MLCWTSTVSFDYSVVRFPHSFLLINGKKQRSLTSVHPLEDEMARPKEGKCVSLRRRQEMLRALYRSTVGRYFPSPAPHYAGILHAHTATVHMSKSSVETS